MNSNTFTDNRIIHPTVDMEFRNHEGPDDELWVRKSWLPGLLVGDPIGAELTLAVYENPSNTFGAQIIDEREDLFVVRFDPAEIDWAAYRAAFA